MRPEATEYAGFYQKYVDLVPEADVLPAMAAQLDEMLAFLRAVPEASAQVCHPPYTWTVKEVVGHITDGERVFGYRALRFGRGDTTPLPGFDENAFASAAESNRLPLADVVNEFEAARRSNLYLFRNLPEAARVRSGEANNNRVSVRAGKLTSSSATRDTTAPSSASDWPRPEALTKGDYRADQVNELWNRSAIGSSFMGAAKCGTPGRKPPCCALVCASLFALPGAARARQGRVSEKGTGETARYMEDPQRWRSGGDKTGIGRKGGGLVRRGDFRQQGEVTFGKLEGTIVLDPTTDPKLIDLHTYTKDKEEGDDRGYLPHRSGEHSPTLCLRRRRVKDRPTAFKTDDKTEYEIRVYKREKPKK